MWHCNQFIKIGKEAISVWERDNKDVNLRKNQQRAIYLLLYIHLYIYIFSGYDCPIAFVNYSIVKFCNIFLNFQVLKGENFSLSTHLRCFSPIVMFFFEYTFEQFMQCSFKAGSRNALRGVVFSWEIITLGSYH